MKHTYNRTLLHGDLREAEVLLEVYENSKYLAKKESDLGKIIEVKYNNLVSWDIVCGEKEADEIEKEFNDVDSNHEYLVIHFDNNETSTFRNSHCDLFVFLRKRGNMIKILYLKWIKKKCRHMCRFCKYTKYCDLYIFRKNS